MTSYMRELAEEYGLTVTGERGIRLCFPNGMTVVLLSAIDDTFTWTVWPLGADRMLGRCAHGVGWTIDEPVSDAEGMLRHYLKNTPREDVEAVWPVETLRRINLWDATTSSQLWPKRGGS